MHQEPQPSQIPEAVTPERVRALRAEAAALPTPGATPGGTEPLAAFYNRIADGLPEAVRDTQATTHTNLTRLKQPFHTSKKPGQSAESLHRQARLPSLLHIATPVDPD